MTVKSIALACALGFICSATARAAGVDDPIAPTAGVPDLAIILPVARPLGPIAAHQLQRPAVLPALYVTLAALEGWDVYSTSAAIHRGAHEANPAAASFASNQGSLVGLKLATTATTIFCAERAWKKNPVAAVLLMTAINGATAAVALHNLHNARLASTR